MRSLGREMAAPCGARRGMDYGGVEFLDGITDLCMSVIWACLSLRGMWRAFARLLLLLTPCGTVLSCHCTNIGGCVAVGTIVRLSAYRCGVADERRAARCVYVRSLCYGEIPP